MTNLWTTFLAASAKTDPLVPGLDILSGTILGVVLLLVLFGYLWAKPAVDALKERMLKAEEQRDALIKTYEDQVIPALTEVKDKVVPMLYQILGNQWEATQRRVGNGPPPVPPVIPPVVIPPGNFPGSDR